MKKLFLSSFLIYLSFFNLSHETPSLTIGRARSHADISGTYTPLDVSLSTEDKSTKVKPVDLICVVDVSGSMMGAAINLVLESLKYLINLMDESDNFALVTFSSDATLVSGLTKMTEENKKKILDKISGLNADGSTNIYDGLKTALDLFKDDYSSGDRIASIILLSDGYDNHNYKDVVNVFKNYLKSTKKDSYVFTLYTFGYGTDFDYELLNQIALIKDGAYFNIAQLSDVGDAFLKIYGSLSTIINVDVQLKIQSRFKIVDVYGIEDMHDANITSGTISSFYVKLIQVVYGKKYDFVLLVDVPRTTPLFTEVLNATVSKLDLFANFLWDGKFSPPAYEEYIRCIVVDFFEEGYNKQSTREIDTGIEWIKGNYNGTRNWVKELNGVKADLEKGGNEGYANALSKISELKTSRIGTHYDEGNSYQIILISNSHNLNISKFERIEIKGQKLIDYIDKINYYYFYLNEGMGRINNLTFSGKSSSLIIYSDETSGQIDIISDDYFEIYFDKKAIQRIQINVDFNHVGKFIIKKDFPFDFYTRVNGKRDITFNIEFLALDFKLKDNPNFYESLEICAYILSDNDIDNLVKDENILNSFTKFKGEFNKELKMGKIVLKQKDISDNLNSIYNNYLYIIIHKTPGLTLDLINEVQGQFFFIPNNYIFSSVPENIKVFSHLEKGDNSAHMYTLEINSTSFNEYFMIEFESIENAELDITILNYQDVVDNKFDLYQDHEGYEIEKTNISNKIYLNVTKKDKDEIMIMDNKIILSIFSKNEGHIPSSNLSYIFKYSIGYYSPNIITTDLFRESTLITEINLVKETTNNFIGITSEFIDSTNEFMDTTNKLVDKKNELIETTNKLMETTNELTETTNELTETTNEIEKTNNQIIINQLKVILLGFAKYSYITSNKLINFLMYFAYLDQNIYANKISINIIIRYKNTKRYLQANLVKQGKCTLIEDNSLNQKKYNCALETNGEDIDNISLDRNIIADDSDIDFSNIDTSPMGLSYINNIQSIGDQDPFDNKKLYILDQSEIIINNNDNNNNNQLNIVGYMNEKNFEYDKFDLDMVMTQNSKEKIENIMCTSSKKNDKYNLQCTTKNELIGKLNNAYSNLENANLIVNIPEQNKKSIYFKEISPETNKYQFYRKNSGGLSGGLIALIVIVCSLVSIAIITIVICLNKRRSLKNEQNTDIININSSSEIQNK